MLRHAAAICAERQLQATFVQADAQALPFAAKAMDLVLAMGVLQHVYAAPLAIGETLRTAKPGARLLLIDEHRAQSRILPALKCDNARFQIMNEYFVLDLQI
jgi:ubiquinone/menaquinone biosynthesis C-methylase UbiE